MSTTLEAMSEQELLGYINDTPSLLAFLEEIKIAPRQVERGSISWCFMMQIARVWDKDPIPDTTQDGSKPAFPWHGSPGNQDNLGISALDYACIHLRVPRTGKPWLDEIIQESRRDEFAKAVATGLVATDGWCVPLKDAIPEEAYGIADAMMKETIKP